MGACGGLAFGRHPMHPPTPDDASRIQNIIHKTPTQLPTYNNTSRTRRTPPTPDDASRMQCTPPTPDDASRMQYRHKTCATSPGPGPIVYIYIYRVNPRKKHQSTKATHISIDGAHSDQERRPAASRGGPAASTLSPSLLPLPRPPTATQWRCRPQIEAIYSCQSISCRVELAFDLQGTNQV